MQTEIKPHTKQPQSPTHCPLTHTYPLIPAFQDRTWRPASPQSSSKKPDVWTVRVRRLVSAVISGSFQYLALYPLLLSGFLCNLVSAASFIQRRLQIQLQLPASTTLMSDGDAQREGRRGGGKKHAANKLSVCERVYPSFPKPPAFLLPFFPTPF